MAQPSASGYGDGRIAPEVAEAADFLLPHWNSTTVEQIPARIQLLKKFGKPVVANEDDKTGADAVAALRVSVNYGASYGLMLNQHNQRFPFHFDGAADDPAFYAELHRLTRPPSQVPTEVTSRDYFPPPESQGGWRRLTEREDIRSLRGMDPAKLDGRGEWLLKSDDRNFAAVVIRHGYVVLQVERENSAVTDSRRVASVSKAVCATGAGDRRAEQERYSGEAAPGPEAEHGRGEAGAAAEIQRRVAGRGMGVSRHPGRPDRGSAVVAEAD